MNTNKILAIIPARGGSKGIPKKNIRLLYGKPLLSWTIETALRSKLINRIILSTDDEEIRNVGLDCGAEAPFLRPEKIAQDDTTDLPVYQHTIQWLKDVEKYESDIIVWLRPTSPLRSAEDIDNAVDLFLKHSPDWVRSVCEVEHHPYWMYRLENQTMIAYESDFDMKKFHRRQLLPPVYRINGAVDVTWRKTIEEKKLYSGFLKAYVMPVSRSVDIDTELDFTIAEAIMCKRYFSKNI